MSIRNISALKNAPSSAKWDRVYGSITESDSVVGAKDFRLEVVVNDILLSSKFIAAKSQLESSPGLYRVILNKMVEEIQEEIDGAV